MENNTIDVYFFASINGEDLFKACNDIGTRSNRVYVRQPANVPSIVFWATANKWHGGYEADTPLRPGIIVRVHDGKYSETVLFEEVLVEDTWNSGSSAAKVGAFSYEIRRALEKEITAEYGLADYAPWKKWLLEDKAKFGIDDYDENWLYCYDTKLSSEILGTYRYLGVEVKLHKTAYQNYVSKKTWAIFELKDAKDNVFALCGFIFPVSLPNGNAYATI